jgi:hypothetical protein
MGIGASRCPVCRQFELGELEWLSLSTIFNFDYHHDIEFEDMPSDAQMYARAFQRGEVTDDELHGRADALFDRAGALMAPE